MSNINNIYFSPQKGLSKSAPKLKNQKTPMQNNSPSFGAKQTEISGKKVLGIIKFLGDDFTSAGQRLLTGVTALLTQPWFDFYNKKTDERTRLTSTARTFGKILAGTLTGVTIRHFCIKGMNRFCKNAATENEKVLRKLITESEKVTEFSKLDQLMLPKKYLNASFREIKKYRNAVGTFAAVIIMIGTNFLIDAPLTIYLTNYLTKKFTKGLDSPQNKVGGEK